LGAVLNIWKADEHRRELTQLKSPYGGGVSPIEYADDYVRGVSSVASDIGDLLTTALVEAGATGLTDTDAVFVV
jgi:hypothetical protein